MVTTPPLLPAGHVPSGAELAAYRAAILELQAGPWQIIAPQNGWTNVSSSYVPFRFRPLAGNRIEIEANLVIGNAAGGVIVGNIPAPYRPALIRGWPVTGNGPSPKAELWTDGNIHIWDYTTGLWIAFCTTVCLDA